MTTRPQSRAHGPARAPPVRSSMRFIPHKDRRRVAAALKLVCTLFFTLVALAIFVWRGQVDWTTGLVLAVGNMIGAHYGVRLAVKVKPKTLKWVMFFMTLVAVIAAFLK